MKFAKIENGKVVNIIKASQDFIDNQDGEFVQCDSCAIGDIWDGISFSKPEIIEIIIDLAQAKKDKLQELKERYQAQIDELYKDYPKFEMNSFEVQKAEWTAYQNDQNAKTDFIDNLAMARGKTREEMLTKIGQSIAGIAQIQGSLQAKRDLVQSATTIEELEAI